MYHQMQRNKTSIQFHFLKTIIYRTVHGFRQKEIQNRKAMTVQKKSKVQKYLY
ncbi:hypothetical protein MA16_Dca008344 [Dendrobium catenatum]|uniref:Uncharacterized protein n=1 Tax=Dendrobium catenatum TaxID=906689 RepID=A0A2I0W825_9ASPA|nr:hypothetical protein MA16_Dca008344 [Dendrobium catenatum]